MFLSKLFLPITKNLPADAKIKSHQLMLRSGMIKQSSAGIYSWLPLGLKVMKKIEQVVREEQNKIGAQELLMPTIQSADIWKESGRYNDYGEEMLRIKDRQGREMLYGPTNEELITDIFRSSIKSYKSLPQMLYHIQWKFRDEIRPRFGVMRCREFFMKDAYSFDLDDASAKSSYNKMFFSYLKTFKRLGLEAIPMAADTGPIGGDLSHEFIILAETGESKIYTDKRIFDLKYDDEVLEKNSLKKLREKYEKFYAVTDEKFDQKEFDKNVNKDFQMTSKGIEVGHIFSFGTKYSESMKANVLDRNGKEGPVYMGSYGIGISRLVGAIIEYSHDEKGIVWPNEVAPFLVGLINLKSNDNEAKKIADKIYSSALRLKIDILYDDKSDNAGVKFSRMDLIGLPFQIIVGNKAISDNLVEIKNRKTGEASEVKIDTISDKIKELIF